tara:strand:+ start:613 stop:819 length:207 start_codon:yes stop_codon:yes gene_type:complete
VNKEIEKTKDLYKQTFNTDSGAKVLTDLEARCNFKTLSYVAGDANATAFEEGKRAVILHIYNMIREES